MKHDRYLVISGPNLNLPGLPDGSAVSEDTREEIHASLHARARELGVTVECTQSNHEGQIIDILQSAPDRFDGIIINAGALAYYSYALRSAIESALLPCIEVYVSNVHACESFHHTSVVAPACVGVIGGFGRKSYLLALEALVNINTGSTV